jgi:hypothetical protein
MNLWWPLLFGAVVGMWVAHILTAMFAIPHGAAVAVVLASIVLGPLVAAFVVAHRARR